MYPPYNSMTVADHDNPNFANYWKCLTESLLTFKTAKEILTKIVNAPLVCTTPPMAVSSK